MEIDKDKIISQEETNEEALMDKATDRAEAEMERIRKETREDVSEGLQEQKID